VFFHPQKHIKDVNLTFLFDGLLVFLNPWGVSHKKKSRFRHFFHLCGGKRIISPPFPPPSGGNGVAIERFAWDMGGRQKP